MTPPKPPPWHRAGVRALAICAVCLALVLLSHCTASIPALTAPLRRRSASHDLDVGISALSADERCRQVHTAEDQCAFVHENCPADEGAFSWILDLYYCHWAHVKPLVLLGLILWLGLLFATISVAASEFFCSDLAALAEILGMSEALAGVTFLAIGNGSPDVFSTFAAMSSNSGSLALGELFGAAGFISAVVAGCMAIIRPFEVPRHTFLRDVGLFTVAAAFSMVFLWDGRLHFWECVVMVAYYLFYVVFVIVWHIWIERKQAKKEREAAARGHFVYSDGDAEHENGADDASGATSTSAPLLREDWSALERGQAKEDRDYEDTEEGARNRWLSEYQGNMRLTRPMSRARRYTNTPIRPSLIGALEFQAALRALERSQNFQTIPMDSRRYSDTPAHTTMLSPDHVTTTTSDPPSPRPVDEHSPLLRQGPHSLAPPAAPAGRARAVSANDAATLRLPHFRTLSPVPSEDNLIDLSQDHGPADAESDALQRSSPAVLVEPATPRPEAPIHQMRGRSPTAPSGGRGLLAPPDVVPANRPSSEYFAPPSPSFRIHHSPRRSPQMVPRASELPRIIIPRPERSPGSSRSTSPFPAYRDQPSPSLTASPRSPSTGPPSLSLPDPLASPESLPADLAAERELAHRPGTLERIWPSGVLPPPRVVIATLFPAFFHWQDKSMFERLIGFYATPTILLLTLSLPVVESEEQARVRAQTDRMTADAKRNVDRAAKAMRDPDTAIPPVGALGPGGIGGKGDATAVTTHVEQGGNTGSAAPQIYVSADPDGTDETRSEDDGEPPAPLWNRWLTIVQLFLAPIVIVLAIYLQASDDLEPRWLVRSVLICLLVSLVLLVPLLLTTTRTRRPSCYSWILSSVGFVVAIAWISTVADQVVGALKALGVIINMSHAIMGLTIFAIGNSCGDLASNAMVASYGLPVMALSACFAGPMMNILLGIGLSGSYSMVRGEERRRHRHPEKGVRFRAFHIEVSQTLLVSGVTLLVTLVGLLVAVPLNRWVMDRRIGYGLIALWCLSTAFNVAVEVTGLLDDGPGAEALRASLGGGRGG